MGIKNLFKVILKVFRWGAVLLQSVKVLGFSSPRWKRGAGGDFITKTFYCNINELLFCEIPLNSPFYMDVAVSL